MIDNGDSFRIEFSKILLRIIVDIYAFYQKRYYSTNNYETSVYVIRKNPNFIKEYEKTINSLRCAKN